MPLVWATRIETRTAAHISEVASGLACSCTCPGCNATLEAVNSENPFWRCVSILAPLVAVTLSSKHHRIQ